MFVVKEELDGRGDEGEEREVEREEREAEGEREVEG